MIKSKRTVSSWIEIKGYNLIFSIDIPKIRKMPWFMLFILISRVKNTLLVMEGRGSVTGLSNPSKTTSSSSTGNLTPNLIIWASVRRAFFWVVFQCGLYPPMEILVTLGMCWPLPFPIWRFWKRLTLDGSFCSCSDHINFTRVMGRFCGSCLGVGEGEALDESGTYLNFKQKCD